MESGEPKAALLYGVTGSGKTRVIIEACKKAVSMGRSAIVLVAEIGLTAQAVGIYYGYTAQFTATAASGYMFNGWYTTNNNGTLGGAVTPTSADITVTVTFTEYRPN